MKLSKKAKNYVPLIPPIQKSFVDFTKDEAQEYFKWFLDHIDERCDYLILKISGEMNFSNEKIDYSVESLKTVWKWFLMNAEIIKRHNKIRNSFFNEQKKHTDTFINAVLDEGDCELSVFTHYMIRDIGMYLGKVLKSNYPILEWTFKTKPKNYISVNEPLLIGFVDDNPSYPKPFYPDLEPIAFVRGCAINLLDGSYHEDDLFNVCMKWIKWIPQ